MIFILRYIVCDRSDDENQPHFEEHDDYIVIGNEVFHKPFVEKPVSGKKIMKILTKLNLAENHENVQLNKI